MREIENGLTNRGMMRTVARLQAQGGLNQKRLSWLDDSLQTAETGDILYFVGCVPFADVLLADRIDNGILSVPRAAIRLLNLVGTRPVVLPNEVCCGLDAYLGGDMDTARSLARLNVEMFRAVGAKRILTSCAGGAWMLRHYSALGLDHGCEVLHVAEFLAQRLDGVRLPAGTALWPSSVSVPDGATERFDLSRLSKVAGPGVVELAKGDAAWAGCEADGWLARDADARERIDHLIEQASAAGCERILTLSPRALMSLRFVLRPDSWVKSGIEVEDLGVFIAGLIEASSK